MKRFLFKMSRIFGGQSLSYTKYKKTIANFEFQSKIPF